MMQRLLHLSSDWSIEVTVVAEFDVRSIKTEEKFLLTIFDAYYLLTKQSFRQETKNIFAYLSILFIHQPVTGCISINFWCNPANRRPDAIIIYYNTDKGERRGHFEAGVQGT